MWWWSVLVNAVLLSDEVFVADAQLRTEYDLAGFALHAACTLETDTPAFRLTYLLEGGRGRWTVCVERPWRVGTYFVTDTDCACVTDP